ncbi:hypothetical protein BSY18_1705 [Blastomonas sp. RAC04]|uniref:hypothetical protein n=1 Tax=Blastomonas sp. RAC04 TaxID=1842535 RepID=UPI0008570946|nr:hypothetical protein [Blastomonas sp. RAC04]AOG01034.1 hypothetical protein BSY18_1705 [Blastomonas sp. RAC04]
MIVRLLLAACLLLGSASAEAKIDRKALISRHDVHLTSVDPHAPVMIGNGELGFTADITGLQTFPEAYAPQSPLLTMAQWAWHSFANPRGWTAADGDAQVPVQGRGTLSYAWFRDFSMLKDRPALVWLRENPHRFSLARISLKLTRRDGSAAVLSDLTATRQRLDLWRGVLISRFVFDGAPVTVETRVAAASDVVLVSVRSPLVATGRVAVSVTYPGVKAPLNPDPSDWESPEGHATQIVRATAQAVQVRRTIDSTDYDSNLSAPGGRISADGVHRFTILGSGQRLVATVGFGKAASALQPFDGMTKAADKAWIDYWRTGGVIDFSGSTDPRAHELERRVVLSQYLARINQAGGVPPQEEGLFSNSWNGKFHLEMAIWHAGHFATWGRAQLLDRMLAWHLEHLPQARALATSRGVKGAWWPKMTGPEGRESPSPINPFIMWQQPHPIFLAELRRRATADREATALYGVLVEDTADLLASWPLPDGTSRVALGPPIVPVQENHDPLTTRDPTFELEYWRWALTIAQQWRERRGLPRKAEWDRVIAALPAPAQADGLYLPVPGKPRFWQDTAGRCRKDATPAGCLNRDHPSFLMAFGLIPGQAIDPAVMHATLKAVESHWDLRQTWGWDFPMIAMTAARLGDPEAAVDWLFADQLNNRWGVTGMTPRVEVEPHATGGPDGIGTKRVADTYFPSNGSLLLAVGMMAAGWDGAPRKAPGFPRKGWQVRVENITPLP